VTYDQPKDNYVLKEIFKSDNTVPYAEDKLKQQVITVILQNFSFGLNVSKAPYVTLLYVLLSPSKQGWWMKGRQ